MSIVSQMRLLGKVALALSVGATLCAQETTGQLVGSVKDPKNVAVAGAKILIRSPQMLQARTVVSDAQGNFRVPLLPVGEYSVTVSKEGYAGAMATNLRISISANVRQDFTLKPVTEASTVVEVISSVGAVDKTDTKTSTSYSAEQLNTLPTAGGDRSFFGASDLAPGLSVNSGGGTSIRGGKTQSTQYTLNGVSVKDEYEGRQNTTRLIDDAVEDTQVIQSPLNARFGRTGSGLVNVVTKSGGNDFSGSIRKYVSRDDWNAVRPHDDGTRSNISSNRQIDIFLSGPIVKDRIWFAVSSIQVPSSGSTGEILSGENPADWQPATLSGSGMEAYDPTFRNGSAYAWDLGKKYVVGTSSDFIDTKVTVALTQDHTIDFGYSQNKLVITNRNPYGVPIVATLGSNSLSQIQLENLYTYGYRGTLNSSTFLEARYSKVAGEVTFPSPPLDHVRFGYGNSGVIFPYGFNIAPATDARNNQSGDFNLKKFFEAAGSHELDLGFQFFESLRGTQTQNGQKNHRFNVPWATDQKDVLDFYNVTGLDPYGARVGYQVANWAWVLRETGDQQATSVFGQAPVYTKFFGRDGVTKNRSTAFYVNDSWTVNSHWNGMFGLRIDKSKLTDTTGVVLLDKQGPLSPRLQVRYDVDGTSKHLFTVTAAKFVEDISAGFSDAFIKKANSTFARYGYTGVADAAGTAKYVDYATVTNPANYGNNLNTPFVFSDVSKNAILTDLSNPYVIEFTLGYKRAYTNGSYFSITGINREWKNDFLISQDYDPSYWVVVPDPTGHGLPSKISQATKYGNSDLGKRRYNSGELEWKQIINATWLFGGNYTYSRLTGNNNGGDQGSQAFRDNAATNNGFFRNALLATGKTEQQFAPEGALVSDQTHKGRVYVTANMPMGKGKISYSFLLRYDSGNAFNATSSNPSNITSVAGAPPAPSTYTRYYMERGALHFNDSYQVDSKIDWSLPIKGKLQLMGYVQVSNIFNHQLQVGYGSGFGASTSVANNIRVASPATFGTDTGVQGNYIVGRNVLVTLGVKF